MQLVYQKPLQAAFTSQMEQQALAKTQQQAISKTLYCSAVFLTIAAITADAYDGTGQCKLDFNNAEKILV